MAFPSPLDVERTILFLHQIAVTPSYNLGILHNRLTRIHVDAIALLKSKIALEAESLAKDSYSVALLNHHYRNYFCR